MKGTICGKKGKAFDSSFHTGSMPYKFILGDGGGAKMNNDTELDYSVSFEHRFSRTKGIYLFTLRTVRTALSNLL